MPSAQGTITVRRRPLDGKDGAPGAPGRDGSQGLDGVILWPSEWAENIEYRNETSKKTSPRYVDVVYIQNKSLASGWEAYICKEGHTSTATNKPSGSTTEYWEKVSNFSAIMAPIILGKNSFINFMQGNRIQIENVNGTVAAGMCAVESSNANTVIWAGQTYANRASAPFRVDSAGKMTATGATITGNITAYSGQIAGLKINGNSLSNDGFDNDATIVLRNDEKNTYVAIGGNVLAPSTGLSAVGEFENKRFNLGFNYGIVIDVQNAFNNTAIDILAGCISGLALKTKIINKTSNANITLDRDVGCVYVDTTNTSGTRDVYITLPTMEHYDDGHVIKIKRGNGAGNEVYIKPGTSKWNTLANSATSWAPHTGSSFIISDNNTVTAGASKSLKIDSEGDAMEFVYFRDLSITQNGTEYRGGWIQFKNPRAW